MFAVRNGMDDLGDAFLSHSAFSRYKNGNIGRGHLDGLFNGAVELWVVANDFKALFDSLNVLH